MIRDREDDDEPRGRGEPGELEDMQPGDDDAPGFEADEFLPEDVSEEVRGARKGENAEGPQIIVVDGLAVIQGAEPLRVLYASDPAEAATRLINMLTWVMGEGRAQILVVLDRKIRRRAAQADSPNVVVHRPEAGETVDSAIRTLLNGLVDRGLAERSTVVTSDLDMVGYAAEIGVVSNLGDLFAASLLSAGTPVDEDEFVKPEGLSPRESREWDDFVAKWKADKSGEK